MYFQHITQFDIFINLCLFDNQSIHIITHFRCTCACPQRKKEASLNQINNLLIREKDFYIQSSEDKIIALSNVSEQQKKRRLFIIGVQLIIAIFYLFFRHHHLARRIIEAKIYADEFFKARINLIRKLLSESNIRMHA